MGLQQIRSVFLLFTLMLSAQNATDKFVLSEETGAMFGGYAEVHFNQSIPVDQNAASLDVHRLVWNGIQI